MKLLENNKNYLQLNKISIDTLNTILIEYEDLFGEESHQTINNVLENFLNRNNLSASIYFTPEIEVLKKIW